MTRFRSEQQQLTGMKTEFSKLDSSFNEIHDLALHRITIERDMREGLEAEEFEMHYQPIVALESGHIAGFEALMRWRKNDGEHVPSAITSRAIIAGKRHSGKF